MVILFLWWGRAGQALTLYREDLQAKLDCERGMIKII